MGNGNATAYRCAAANHSSSTRSCLNAWLTSNSAFVADPTSRHLVCDISVDEQKESQRIIRLHLTASPLQSTPSEEPPVTVSNQRRRHGRISRPAASTHSTPSPWHRLSRRPSRDARYTDRQSAAWTSTAVAHSLGADRRSQREGSISCSAHFALQSCQRTRTLESESLHPNGAQSREPPPSRARIA